MESTMEKAAERKNPWLSVVIPVYNGEKTLEKCLDSIERQTFRDFEVLLVDDGSTDRTRDICSHYAARDGRFRLVNKEHSGLLPTRVFGAKNAAGLYCTFCDADDYYATKRAFERIHDALKDERCDALQFGTIDRYNHLQHKTSPVPKPLDVGQAEFQAREYPRLLCSFWDPARLSVNVFTKVYHHQLLGALSGIDENEHVFWGEDLIVNLHLLENCRSFRFIPDALYCHQAFTGGTKRFSPNTMRDLDAIKRYQLALLTRYPGEKKDAIESILFSEVAGWFLAYVCNEAFKALDEESLRNLIIETLALPRFQLAQEYYRARPQERREAIDLLRLGDPEEYIRRAKASPQKRSLKQKAIGLLKKI